MTAVTERFAPVALGFTFHPKVSDLRRKGPAVYGRALALWLLGRLHADRECTGGVLPDVDLRMVYDAPDVRALAEALVQVGLWEVHPRGYLIHDFDSSGGVLLPAGEAARPGAAQEAAENKRKARNERYRRSHPKTAGASHGKTGETVGKTLGVSREDAGKTLGETARETPEDAPSQTLPSYNEEDVRRKRGEGALSCETPRDAGETAGGKTPSEDAETIRAQVERLSERYPPETLAQARHGCALKRSTGKMADSVWLTTLRRLEAIDRDAVVRALRVFADKYADGSKNEDYLVGIARREADVVPRTGMLGGMTAPSAQFEEGDPMEDYERAMQRGAA